MRMASQMPTTLQQAPGVDLSMLMQLMQPQAPQGMMGGAQESPGVQLPGLPPSLPGQPRAGGGAQPSAAPNSSSSRSQIADALMAKAGSMPTGAGAGAGSGSPAMAGLSGAMQGASLSGALTGKSPLSAIKSMIAPSSPGAAPNPLLDPVAGTTDPMSFVNSLNGMPENPALADALGPAQGLSDGQIAFNQAYLDALSPAGVDQMFSAPATAAGTTGADIMGGAGVGAGLEAGLGAGAEAGLGAGLGAGAGAEAGAGLAAGLTAADLGLGAASAAPAIPAALEGGAAAAGAAEAAGAAGAGAAMGPVGWAGLGIAGLMALLGNDIF